MDRLSTEQYKELLAKAIDHFWNTRNAQTLGRTKIDQGNRSAVTGGKQLDGFIDLFVKIAEDLGVPSSYIFTKHNDLPGYFRPTKDWDFLIVTPKKQLIAVIELKSQVGSFGNNFNNRIEEALGNAVDFWTAFREEGFLQNQVPWVGYVILVEKSGKSASTVKLRESHFNVRAEFEGTSYLDRYMLFCQKLMQERHYTSTSLIWTNSQLQYGSLAEDISIETLILSFMGFIQGKLKDILQ